MKPVDDPEILKQLDATGGMKPVTDERILFELEKSNPTGTFGQNVAAGMGKAVYDVGRGAGQMARSVLPNKVADLLKLPTQADIDEARSLDAPLMNTGGGTVGNVLGNVAMFAPTAMIPGANTVTGAGIGGAVMGALQPTSGDESRLKNTAIGAATGAGAQYVGGKAIDALANRTAAKTAAGVTEQAQNAVRDAALKTAQQAGYVVPPSYVNPNLVNQTLESMGGKISTNQAASLKNQSVTDGLARDALGLNKTALLTEGSLADLRRVAGDAYKAIKTLPQRFNADAQFQAEAQALGQTSQSLAAQFPSIAKNEAIDALKKDLSTGNWTPDAVIEAIKKLRFDAGKNFKAFDDPAKAALAQAQRTAADALDGLVERNLAASGQQALSTAYRDARVLIAKAHDIEAALTPGGHVNAQVLAKMGENGFLSGPLKTIADFGGNFPKAVQPVEKIGGVANALRSTAGAGAGAVAGGVLGGVGGAVAGVAIPWTVRQALLSGAGQRALTTPNYGPGAGAMVSDLLSSPAVRRALPAAGAAAGLNYRAQQ